MSKSKRPAVFLDKDGTIIEDLPMNVDPGKVRLAPTARESLQALQRRGFALVVITNQPGIARGLFPREAMDPVRLRIELLAGIRFDGFCFCPHDPNGILPDYARVCGCRKPQPGLLLEAAKALGLDLPWSWCIGDILHDIEAGNRAGCTTVLLNNGHETEWLLSPVRRPVAVAHTLLEAARLILQRSGNS
jgi:D-glycero-D-manno-heptose 1,7-bisphosphate phosphatase